MGATVRRHGRVARWWSARSVRAKSLWIVSIPMLALALTITSFVVADLQQESVREDIANVTEVRVHLALVLNLAVDAETGVRGFILTRDEQYAAPFEAARTALPTELADLTRLVSGDRDQEAAARTIAAQAEARIAGEARLLAAVRTDAAVDVPTALDEARQDMDALRAGVQALDAVQVARLDQARRTNHGADLQWEITLWLSILLGVVVGVAAALLFTRSVSRRLSLLRVDATAVGAGVVPDRDYDGADDIDSVGRAMQSAAERLAVETALRQEREDRLQAVLDAVPDTILVMDADTTVRAVSAAVESLVGYTPEACVGQRAAFLVHTDDLPAFESWIGRIISGEPTVSRMRHRIQRRSGEWLWVEARGRRLEHGGGEPTRVLLVSRDVTAQTRLEQAREEAAEAAAAANRAKTDFLSRMSHELRTPLNAVLGFAQMLELDDLDADQAAAVHHILRGGRHLLDLINEVLDISRIESGTLSMSPEPVMVSDVVTESVGLMANLAAERGVSIDAAAAACSSYVMADRQRLRQVLLNLLSNAIKYNRPQGTVTVTSRVEDAHVIVTVTDSGHGIASEDVGRLFVPFDRLGAEQTGIEGTGIGLSLALRLAEAMGGTVELVSTSFAGTTFGVTLPVVEGQFDRARRDEARSDRSQATPGSETDAPGFTVVQIEDNPANVKLVQYVLSRRPNVRLVPVLQALEGIEVVRREHPALVLLDLHLPDLDGNAVLQRLKDDPATAGIPVVVVSADATPAQIHRVMAAGAEAYLTKPFDIRELLDVIDRVGRRP